MTSQEIKDRIKTDVRHVVRWYKRTDLYWLCHKDTNKREYLESNIVQPMIQKNELTCSSASEYTIEYTITDFGIPVENRLPDIN